MAFSASSSFLFTPPITVFLDQAAGLDQIGLGQLPRVRGLSEKKARSVQVSIGHVQRHRATLGNLPSLVQIALGAVWAVQTGKAAEPGASEEA